MQDCAVRAYLSTSFGCPFEGAGGAVARRRVDRPAHRSGRVRGGAQRHHRRRASAPGVRRPGSTSRSACPHPGWPCTFTTRAARRSSMSMRASRRALRSSMRRPAASADARMRRAPPATSPPRISSTCSTVSASPPACGSRRIAAASRAIEPLVGHPLPSRDVPRLAGHTRARLRFHRAGPDRARADRRRTSTTSSTTWRSPGRRRSRCGGSRRRTSAIARSYVSLDGESLGDPAARRRDHARDHAGARTGCGRTIRYSGKRSSSRWGSASTRASSPSTAPASAPTRCSPSSSGSAGPFYLTFERETPGRAWILNWQSC